MTTERNWLGKLWEKIGKPMEATNHLHDTRIFRMAVYGPVVVALFLAVLGYCNSPVESNWTLQGFNSFISLFKLPIGIAGLAIPFAALIASHHRSIQSASQIASQQNQNIFSNYVKHKEYFGKYLEDENLLNGKTSFKAENKQVYNVLFPFAAEGDLKPHLLLTHEEKEQIGHLVLQAVNLSEEITWKSQDQLRSLGICIAQLRAEIQHSFNLEIINPNYALSVENLLIELKTIITTIDHLSSASTFLDAYKIDGSLANWSITLNFAIMPLEKVRQFEHVENRIKELTENCARIGSITVNSEQVAHVKSLLANNPREKLDKLKEKFKGNDRTLGIIKIIEENL